MRHKRILLRQSQYSAESNRGLRVHLKLYNVVTQ